MNRPKSATLSRAGEGLRRGTGSLIEGIGTALPAHRLEAPERRRLLTAIWPRLAMLGGGLEDAGGTRYLAEPAERLLEERGLTEAMVLYEKHATRLSAEAARQALFEAGVEAAAVDVVISVSCTGYLVPALDVRLVSLLGLRPDVVRIPLTELGCSGGAAAIALAHRHLAAYPDQRVLVVAVELPSLTFHPGDSSLDNLTAAMVFGDGAAAMVMRGAAGGARGLAVQEVASHLVADTSRFLGYDLRDDGFHVVLDRRLPRLVGGAVGEVVQAFRCRVGMERIEFVAAHGGGPRILEAVESSLLLAPELLAPSRRTYFEVGNVSSASLLFTLGAMLPRLGEEALEGLGMGLGPGVSIDLLHLTWTP